MATFWPMPKFYFQVSWGGEEIAFQEVAGLDVTAEVIEYRHGNSTTFSTIKRPGLISWSNVTMKKGVFASDTKFWTWYSTYENKALERKDVTIKLLNDAGEITFTWSLVNAWATKVTFTDFSSESNDPAIEEIEIAHEGLKLVL